MEGIVFCIAGIIILAAVAFCDFLKAKRNGVSVADIIDRRTYPQENIIDGRRRTDAISD